MNNECNHKWVLVSDIFNEVVKDSEGVATEVNFGVYKCVKCNQKTNIQLESNYDVSLNDFLLEKNNNDQILSDMIYDYFVNTCRLGENNSKRVIQELYNNKPVYDELIKFLTIESFDYDNPLNIHGFTAKQIREQNPVMSDLEVFEALNFVYTKDINK